MECSSFLFQHIQFYKVGLIYDIVFGGEFVKEKVSFRPSGPFLSVEYGFWDMHSVLGEGMC